MKRWMWVVLGAVVVAVGGGLWWKSRAKGEAPRYRTAVVERGAIRSVVSATGTIQPVVKVEVGSQVSGTVSKLFVDYNARVTEGQLLCQLEPSSFRARAAQAEAAVARADAALKEAQRKLRRSRELVRDNYVSQADVEAAEVEVELREADLKQARAQHEAAAVDLSNTTIRAPIDGVVIARSIDVGQTVAASLQAPKLFVIANDLSQMQVETRIDEADIGRIHSGLPVTFTVDAYADMEFRGEVTQVRLEPIVEQGVVTYTTVIRTQNRDLKLRPGMTANVTVLVATKEGVLKIPGAALRFTPPAPPGGKRGGPGAGGGAGMRAGGGEARGGGGQGAGAVARPGDANAATRQTGGEARGAEAGAGGGGMREGEAGARGQVRAQGGSGGAGDGRWAKGGGAEGGHAMRRGPGAAEGTGAGAAGAAMGAGFTAPADAPAFKPGAVYVLRDGKPARVQVQTGLGDGASFEVESEVLKQGDAVIVGLEASAQNRNLQPPPGMGGPRFGPPPGRGSGGGGRTR